MPRIFKVFNVDRTKNKEVIWFVPLELKINRHIEEIDAAVVDPNSIDIL